MSALPCAAVAYDCEGFDPDWSLTFDDVQAQFVFPAPTELEVLHQAIAEGRDWPQAFTLIGRRDTAIVVLQEPQNGDYAVQVLTQRAEQPILLHGSCEADPE